MYTKHIKPLLFPHIWVRNPLTGRKHYVYCKFGSLMHRFILRIKS